MTQETIFEKIANHTIPAKIVYEDSKHIAFLDISPFEKGHTLVIPKKKYERITDMPDEEYINLQKIAIKIAKNMKKVLGKNIGTLVYGEDVPHVHIHLFPITKDLNLTNTNLKPKIKYLKNEDDMYQKKLKINK